MQFLLQYQIHVPYFAICVSYSCVEYRDSKEIVKLYVGLETCLVCIEQIRFGENVYFEENGCVFLSKADDGKGFLFLTWHNC